MLIIGEIASEERRGTGGYESSLYFLLSFSVNLKLLQK